MRIKDIMITDVDTVQADDYAEVAWDRMNFKGIRHLVVLKGNDVSGIISDNDLGGHQGESLRKNRQVKELMSPDQAIVKPETTLKEAANIFRGASVDCVPVMEKDKLVGVLTVTDLLEVAGVGVERTRFKKERKPDLDRSVYRRAGHSPKKRGK